MKAKEELMTATEVCERLRISRMSLHNWRKKDGFPEPMKGPGKNGTLRWHWSDIQAWLRGEKGK
jgi:predicted DNA-binding transcriptional regulator AlpA